MVDARKDDPITEVREYWDRRPCNIRHSNAPIGSREYFDEVEKRKYFVEPHIPGFCEFDKWKGKKVLDIGCGIGTQGASFAKAGAEYTAVEISEESLRLAKQRFEAYGLKGTFHLGNAEELGSIVPVERYDLVFSFGVIHHTPHPQNVISQVAQYMDRDSEFRLMLYAKNSWKDIMVDAGLDQPEAQSRCPFAFTYTHQEIRELLVGFDVTSITQDHIFPYVVEKYVRHEYELQPWFAAMPPGMFRALEARLGWHALIKCRLK